MDSQDDHVPLSAVSQETGVKPASPQSTLAKDTGITSSSSSPTTHLPRERLDRATQAEDENVEAPEPPMAPAAYPTPMKMFRQELQDFDTVLSTRTASAFPGENSQAINRLMNMTMPSYTFRSYAKAIKTLGIDLPGFNRNDPSKTPWMTNLYDASDRLRKEEGRADRTQLDAEIQAEMLAAKLAACNVCCANPPFLAPGEPVYETYSGKNLQEALESHNARAAAEEKSTPSSSEPDRAEDRVAFHLLRRHAEMRALLKEISSKKGKKGPLLEEALDYYTPRDDYPIELAVYGWSEGDFVHIDTASLFYKDIKTPASINKLALGVAVKDQLFNDFTDIAKEMQVSQWMWITGNGESWKCFKPVAQDAGALADYVNMLQDQFELSDKEEEECGEVRCLVLKKIDTAGVLAWLDKQGPHAE